MKTHLKGRTLVITLAGTAMLYAGFATLVTLQPALFAPISNPAYPVLSKLLFPFYRWVSDLTFTLVLALLIYLLYRLLTRAPFFSSRRIARSTPAPGQVRRETLLNANLVLAAAIQGTAYIALSQLGLSKMYSSIAERGWPYAIFSLVVFAVLSDASFYLWHRIYHDNRFVFRHVHSVHHLSVVTTPMTNSQISPWELLPSALFGVLFIMTVPIAMPVVAFLVIAATIYLMILHSGYEIFPRGMATHWLGKWLVTPTYHQMHHELFTKHMGLYFTWWDRWCRTYSQDYENRFAEVTGSGPKVLDGEARRESAPSTQQQEKTSGPRAIG